MTTTVEVKEALRRVGRKDDSRIDLAEAALTLAAFDCPGAPVDTYRDHLGRLAVETAEAVSGANSLEEKVDGVNAVLFERHGYQGDSKTYDDMQNANLTRVIDRRKGLPVALGILYIHVARAQGWQCNGTNFPAHFLVRLETDEAVTMVDPFYGGQVLDRDALERRLESSIGEGAEFEPEHCAVVGDRAVLIRLQNNIKLRAIQDGDLERVAEILHTMILIAPDQAAIRCEFAAPHARQGEVKAAIRLLEDFVVETTDRRAGDSAAAYLARLRSRLH
jgi:regulator of sirC expression with transglutaminase-like and TPR domain